MPRRFTPDEPSAAARRSHSMDALLLVNTPSSGALQVGGLPLHPLIVHAVVILLPLTVAGTILGTVWPAARRRLGIVTPLGALIVLILVPITVAAGESLRDVVGPVPGVERHEMFGRMLLPWAIALFLATAGQWAWYRWGEAHAGTRSRARFITIAIGIVAVLIAVGALVMVVLIGESGSRAVWGG